MQLTTLEPTLFRYEIRVEPVSMVPPEYRSDNEAWHRAGCPSIEVTKPRTYLIPVPTVAEAHGVMFLCPKCYRVNSGPVGTHRVSVPFAGRQIPTDADSIVDSNGNKVFWSVSGTSLEDLSTAPSILIGPDCNWHGYITNGNVSEL